MSVLADEQAIRAFPKHQEINGDDITRLTSADVRETVVGVWSEYSEDQLSSQRPTRSEDEGLRITRHGLLLVQRDQVVADTDQWVIVGELWQVQRLGTVISGYRELYLQTDDKKWTQKVAKHRIV